MSYDIRFGVKVAGAPDNCFAVIGCPEYDSPTYNLRDIFVRSMDWNYHQGEWYSITDVLPKIQKGIDELTQHPEKYKPLERITAGELLGAQLNVSVQLSIISVMTIGTVWAAVGTPTCR